MKDKESNPLVLNSAVKERLKNSQNKSSRRTSSYEKRAEVQNEFYNLPELPTTTIGSFPQTKEIRQTRASYKKNELSYEDYAHFMKNEIKLVVDEQEKLGLDVLVHGEPERNDMVEYFGENFDGFAFTKNGWVQSYGTRCVKPPIIYGDVSRQKPITVDWTKYAQSLTKKHMKGMLTGPITILQWSFVRNDQAESETANQIAFALLDEVLDLEKAGITIIQVDEPAIREGLPLRRVDYKAYLDWSVNAFRLSVCDVKDTTQIHTHMCYSEFNEIMQSIADLDADVISIEASRSKMVLLDAFSSFNYPNEIGPGVYDIHTPRVPKTDEMVTLLKEAMTLIPKERLWVNPDCGLKTRNWEETREALQNMIAATKKLRV